jgi:polyisoprenyl-phosphate glycosyltransferase
MAQQPRLVSILTPAFREELNLPLMHDRLAAVFTALAVEWEWVIVDDHSPDGTWQVIQRLAAEDARVRGVRLARNSGSHVAVQCALDLARGDVAIVMAADLQDPPEALPEMLERWRQGAQVVWAVREQRQGEGFTTLLGARLFYFVMRHVVGLREMSASGADFFLVDRRALAAVRQIRERNASLFALVAWMGFRQDRVSYDKHARQLGTSGWTLQKKVKLAVDSITSFTFRPIRWMSYLGFVTALMGFLYAGVVVANALAGQPVQGWSSLMVVVLVIGGIQMLMLGVLGEYLWRALDESRGRPRYFIESSTDEREADDIRG